MDERTTGVIMRVHPLTESSLIVRWLTEDFGRLATVAKGATRPKSSFRGKLDLFHQATLVFRRSRRSDLHALVEVELCDSRPLFRQHWELLQLASQAVRLLERVTEPETPLPEFYSLFCRYLASIQDRGDAMGWHWAAFQAQSLKILGVCQPAELTSLNAGARAVLKRLLDCDWPTLSLMTPSPEDSDAVTRFLDQAFGTQWGESAIIKRPNAGTALAAMSKRAGKMIAPK